MFQRESVVHVRLSAVREPTCCNDGNHSATPSKSSFLLPEMAKLGRSACVVVTTPEEEVILMGASFSPTDASALKPSRCVTLTLSVTWT